MLYLINFTAILHQLDCFIAAQGKGLDGQILFYDCLHLFFDGGQVLLAEFDVAKVNVIVKSLLSGRTIGKMSVRIEMLYRLGHNMGCGMADDVEFFLLGAFRRGAVVVDDFHFGSLQIFAACRALDTKRASVPCRDGCSIKMHPRFHPACFSASCFTQ